MVLDNSQFKFGDRHQFLSWICGAEASPLCQPFARMSASVKKRKAIVSLSVLPYGSSVRRSAVSHPGLHIHWNQKCFVVTNLLWWGCSHKVRLQFKEKNICKNLEQSNPQWTFMSEAPLTFWCEPYCSNTWDQEAAVPQCSLLLKQTVWAAACWKHPLECLDLDRCQKTYSRV